LAVLIVLQNLLSPVDMAAWGWRIPFLIGAVLALVVFWIQSRLPETRVFEAQKGARKRRGDTLSLIRQYPRQTATIVGLTAGGSMIFYVYTTYMQKFLTNTSGFSKDAATSISAATLFVFMIVQPLFGWLSDKTSRKTMLLIAFGGGALATWPVMSGVARTHNAPEAFGWILLSMLLQSGYTSISAVVKAELFPTHIRALGVGLPYALANAAFGGTAEYVALWFKSIGSEAGFYLYASALLAIGFFVALSMRDPRAAGLIHDD
jgi:MHS family alpha-ketoglutarate permease-like MFS transporter